MTTKNKWYKRFGWASIALCGLCCALPIIGTAIGITSLTAISFYLEKIGVLSLGIAVFFFWYFWNKRQREDKECETSCDTNCDCKTEILP
jgi:hypothetical protein